MSDIKMLCQFRWDDIHSRFGVNSDWLTGRHQACPFCQAGKDRFRYTNHEGNGGFFCSQCGSGDGFELLERYTQKPFKEIVQEIRQILGDTHAKPQENSDVSKIRRKLKSTWDQASALSKGCPTHRYLLNRGLQGLEFGTLQGIKCHPGIVYWHREDGELMNLGKHPAMIGLVTTVDGWPATLHVTYLTKDGRKAALDPVKKILPPSRKWKGGSIRMQPIKDGQTLCVAEGIETALAMKLQYPDCCPWAVISAGNMESFIPPNDDSSAIYIAADNDASYTGQAAAYSLAKTLSGKKLKASVLMPKKQGHDFLDEYNEQKQATA